MTLKRVFTAADIDAFANVSGDHNTIHSAQAAGPKGGRLVHGMLSGSLFSALFGTRIPASVYVSQQLRFRAPIYTNEALTASIVPRRLRARVRLLECDTSISKDADGTLAVEGVATVLLPEGVDVETPANDE